MPQPSSPAGPFSPPYFPLATKLHLPAARPGSVPRPRLIQWLDRGLDRKLTLISAPAGFGKTTLLSQWCHARGSSPTASAGIAWLSLDSGDNDPVRFLAYLAASLRSAAVDGPSLMEALRQGVPGSDEPAWAEALVTALIDQVGALGRRLVLVLDDYHVITAEPVHRALAFWLEHLPPNLHLVIATRADPPLPLAHWRGRGQLNELRPADLRFSADEASRFLEVMGLTLPAAEAATLHARTEGWIAGLQMAAISLLGQDDPKEASRFISAFSGGHRHILDYLLEEVLGRQPEQVQAFLLNTSILDRLTAPLCEALTGREDGQVTLEAIEQSGLFIVPLDGERRWYRYHQLFAELLCRRLNQKYPDQVPELHRRASAWYAANHLTVPAVGHLLAAGDIKEAAEVVAELVSAVPARVDQTTLLRWLDALPDEEVLARPELCLHYASLLAAGGRLNAAERHLEVAERAIRSADAKGQGERLGMVAAVRAFISRFRGDVPAILRFSCDALARLPRGNLAWRAGIAILAGDAHSLRGEFGAASRAYAEALPLCQAAGNPYSILIAYARSAANHLYRGRLRGAAELCQEGLRAAAESGFSEAPLTGAFHALLCEVYLERNDLEAALQQGETGVALTRRSQFVVLQGTTHLTLSRVQFARRDLPAAWEAAQTAARRVSQSDAPPWLVSRVQAWLAHLLTARGERDAAARLLHGRGVHAASLEEDGLLMGRAEEYLALARLLAVDPSSGEPARPEAHRETAQLLDRLLEVVRACQQMGLEIEILLLQALTSQPAPLALDRLAQALALAQTEGYVRVFLSGGAPTARLLGVLPVGRGPEEEYRQRLLTAFREEAAHRPSVTAGYPAPRPQDIPHPLMDPLTRRELQVLTLVAEGRSNQQIAARLSISPHTVKWHTGNIYSKLSVGNRTQAVARARALDLLPPSPSRAS